MATGAAPSRQDGAQSAGASPAAPGRAALVETHTAVLVFLGDRVYKVKKPVDLGFLDFRTVEARRGACEAEVALNRRLAPDVYLGTADVIGPDGRCCDHMVVMRRLPAERRLAALVAAGGEVAGPVRDTARLIASFHSRCGTSEEITVLGGVAAQRRLWADSLAAVAPYVGDVLPAQTVAEIELLARRYLDGRDALLRDRQRSGLVRDGHGDLLADDVFCLDDGPRVLDCLEFDPRLRAGDVLADVAFLAMDLQRLGRVDLAEHFMSSYREFSGEHHPRSLEDFYVAYRALVRCKVACVRVGQGDAASAATARALAALALARLRRGRVRLVLVGGLPAAGKSTLAAGLADAEGWTVLRSDVIRKELTGLAARTPAVAEPGQGIYRPETTGAVYDEMIRRAGIALERGESVVLDASWARREHRHHAARCAAAAAADLIELRCAVSPEVARARITARLAARLDAVGSVDAPGTRATGTPTVTDGTAGPLGADDGVSDATIAVLEDLTHRTDPWPDATTIFTLGPLAQALHAARRATS
ncbi:AAA family ATPase [Frankia sp. AgB32]|uniref:bifunctional aminoglycoside phosphotransferase/ATP-binding protein n=1 Tax=Frankia sp. AgB32 TaxID=631119 RepID=UPI00200EC924|nr:AAA family ATPase [Frankia sp. AgB32]MCK9893955.1 AAA family ATPase [Frankia sp. AgB32]